jgi:hypothetical protein
VNGLFHFATLAVLFGLLAIASIIDHKEPNT